MVSLFSDGCWPKLNSSGDLPRVGNFAALIRASAPEASRAATSRPSTAARSTSGGSSSRRGPFRRAVRRLGQVRCLHRPRQIGDLRGHFRRRRRHQATCPSTVLEVSVEQVIVSTQLPGFDRQPGTASGGGAFALLRPCRPGGGASPWPRAPHRPRSADVPRDAHAPLPACPHNGR